MTDLLPGNASAVDQFLQAYMLQGVSRTFALTIPQLPGPLARVVVNAYLLCRIVDTIEDEPWLALETKGLFCERFVRVVSGREDSQKFSSDLLPLLSGATAAAERHLIRHAARVIRVTLTFNARQRAALERCIRVMARGMSEFQAHRDGYGLDYLAHLDRYCYHVAGVVGEMLTTLFCDYSQEIAKREDALMDLSTSFGQGLQMTNILQDIRDDMNRGVCWLPRDVFADAGFDLAELSSGACHPSFGRGLTRLIGLAHGHLKNAIAYTLMIPKQETGIRHFCLWAIGMAVLTLRKIHKQSGFGPETRIKISRRSVQAAMIAARLAAGNDRMLRSLFYLAGKGLPSASVGGIGNCRCRSHGAEKPAHR